MYHGKKKDEPEEDQTFINATKKNYEMNMNIKIAQQIVKLVPDDYYAQNKLKDCMEIDDALSLNLLSLYANPKSYTAWYHRKYILKTADVELLEKEYKLVEGCLELDSRNFHCWNYKRFLDTLAEKYTDLRDYRLKIGRKTYTSDFSNYSSAHDLLVCGDSFHNLESILYTDPLDHSAWSVYSILESRKLYNTNNYYVKVYADKFVICFSDLPENLNIKLNGEELDCHTYLKYTSFEYTLRKEDVLIINGKRMDIHDSNKVYARFVDEIVDLEDKCVFGFLEKLKHVSDKPKRRSLVEHLSKIDPFRKLYYRSLVHQYFYTIT